MSCAGLFHVKAQHNLVIKPLEIYQFQIHQPLLLTTFLRGYILLMSYLFMIDCLIEGFSERLYSV